MIQENRLRARIGRLRGKIEDSREATPEDGNPYIRCKSCWIRDPELSIRDGKHLDGCEVAILINRLEHYEDELKKILDGETNPSLSRERSSEP